MRLLRSTSNAHTAGMLLLLAVTLGATRLASDRKAEPLAFPLDSIDRQIGGFRSNENPALPDSEIRALNTTSYLSRTYRSEGRPLDVFIAFYASQRAGESMHSPKHCLPGSGWEIWDYGRTEVPVNGRNFSINLYRIERDGERRTVLYWYQSKGRIIASEYEGKFVLAKDALLHQSTSGSIVRIVVADDPAAIEAARKLATGLIPQLQHCFGG